MKKGVVAETLCTIIWALAISTIFRSFFYEPYHIPSSSMKPNLLIGDYIMVSKMSYGYSKYSFPFGPPIFKGRIFDGDKPKRGDVIVFRYPKNTKINYIKRLVGLPNDKIQMIDGVLHINGNAVKKEYVEDYPDIEQGRAIVYKKYEETMPGDVKHFTLDAGNNIADNTKVYTVPDGHYFFMGDNRDYSQDSRFMDAVGFVPEENLIGRAVGIFIPRTVQYLDRDLAEYFHQLNKKHVVIK